jgi:acyl-CoA thioesterase FadM
MNNGRYLAIMDLGRMDCFLRCGLFQAARAAGWNPVLSAAQVRFRRELRLFQKFRLETRILYWEETTFVMEHRILIDMNGRRDVVATQALMRGGLYDRKARGFVPVADLFARMNVDAVSPPASEAVSAFLAAEEALKRAA